MQYVYMIQIIYFRGWLPRALTRTPAVMISRTTYETCKDILISYDPYLITNNTHRLQKIYLKNSKKKRK